MNGSHGNRVVLLAPERDDSERVRLLAGLLADAEPLDATSGQLERLRFDVELAARVHDSDVIVLVRVPDGPQLEEAYAAVRERTASPIVLVAAEPLSLPLIDHAARIGVFDVLDPGVDAVSLHFALERAAVLGAAAAAGGHDGASRREAPHLISVLSVRGGAGATTIAVNLAAAKARIWGRDTMLLDLDLDGADVALACGIVPDRTVIDLVRTHGDIDWLKLRSHLEHTSAGFALLPGSRWADEARPVRPELLLDVVAAARGHADVVIADLPQNFGAPTVAALERSDAVLLVLTPEVAAIKHALHMLQQLEELHFEEERIHVSLNRAGAPGMLHRRDVEQALGRRVALALPEDSLVPESLNAGVPLIQRAASAPAARAFVELCELLGEGDDPGMLRRARRRLIGRRRIALANSGGR